MKWYRLGLSLYLTDEQVELINTKWPEVFMRTVQDILPAPNGPTFYVDDVVLVEEE